MNEDELKGKIREGFNIVAKGYDNPAFRYFAESAGRLPGYLDLKGDERVLDVATGTGHAAISIAAALPQGQVTGIDFSEGMLARAKAKISKNGISNIRLVSMDMQDLDFPDHTFDAAVFSFSIFFVEDMEGELRHAARKVKPGGKVLATSFNEGTFSPQVELYFDRVKKYGIEVPSHWKRLSSPEECRSLFEKAGLTEISIHTKDIGYYLADENQWWDIVWNAGLRRYVNDLSVEDLENFRREHLKEIKGLSTDNGIWLEVEVLYALGTCKAADARWPARKEYLTR